MPAQFRLLHAHFEPRHRRERPPAMPARRIQGKVVRGEQRGPEAHLPAQSGGPRHRNLPEIDDQFVAAPEQHAGTDLQVVTIALHRRRSAFGKRPAFAARAVKNCVQCTVSQRVGGPTTAGGRIVRGEYTADESDQGQGMTTVIAQGVNVPPVIAVPRNTLGEVRSCSRLAAASRPDSAAIGRPGPG